MLRLPLLSRSLPAGESIRLGLLGFLCLASLLLLAGWTQAPIARKYAAKASLQKAREAGAEILAVEALRAAEEAFAAGARDLDLQYHKTYWKRAYGRSEAMFDSALRRARLAEAIARRREAESRDRTRLLLSRAESGFDQMEWASGYIPPRSPIRSDVRKARVSYDEATALLAGRDYLRAAEAAQRANAGIEAAYTRFSRYIQASTDPARTSRYDRWVKETVSWSERHGSEAIIIDKTRRTLHLIVNGRRVRTYRAELGVNGTLTKVVSGDRATPEGMYRITEKRGPRQTRWYKALLLNYPNEDDLKRFKQALRRGQVSRRARPGGLIEIHGEGGRGGDWTDGCVALGNREMDDLFGRVSVGTPVTIVGYETDEPRARGDASGRTALRRGAQPRGSAGAGGLL